MRTLILLALIPACSDYKINPDGDPIGGETHDDSGTPVDDTGDPVDDSDCPAWDFEDREVGVTDLCEFGEGSFSPIIEWNIAPGGYSRATVAVGDLDLDGVPDIVANVTALFGNGTLYAMRGDGSETLWTAGGDYGYAAAPSIADLDDDGSPEIVIVQEYSNSMLGVGDYTVVALDATGAELWESEHFVGDDFDYGGAPVISDMDHDGSPEIVIGRVILWADGTTRGVGEYGRGSFGSIAFGELTLDEGCLPAVADLDLDGVEEVIVGNAMYAPDGSAIWKDVSEWDAMVGVANLDGDAEGEFIAISNNTVRAVDTDGTIIWGPETLTSANIMSPPAIDDLDLDGYPEIVVAGGNFLVVYNHDGSELWRTGVTDLSGASGASIFDFEGDGYPEVAYIDEVEMAVYDGATGALKFYSRDHASDTMYDYPIIADVDGDDHAEIVVAHAGWDAAVSIYGDADNSWAPARKVWNQHAYSITNINDDLSVPTTATPNFSSYNSWHSAFDREAGTSLTDDLEGEILGVCEDDCDGGVLRVAGRLINRSDAPLDAGIAVALYAVIDGEYVIADVAVTTVETPSGMTGEVMDFEVATELAKEAASLVIRADDDGTGTGAVSECSEDNNIDIEAGGFCD